MKFLLISFVALAGGLLAASLLNVQAGGKTNSVKVAPENVTVRLLKEDGTFTEPAPVLRAPKGRSGLFAGSFTTTTRRASICVGCGLPLFRSDAKFESGTGCPSFFQPVAAENAATDRAS